MRKLWVVSQCCDMEVELQVEGTTWSSVTYPVHQYQVEQGVQKDIYHPPAHGSGGCHKAPYLAPGDYGASQEYVFLRRTRMVRSREWLWGSTGGTQLSLA